MKKLSLLLIAIVLFSETASAGESYELKRLRNKVESRRDKLESVEEKIEDLKLVLAEMKVEAEQALTVESSIEGMIVKERENRFKVEELESEVKLKAALLTEYRRQFQVKYEFEPEESLGDLTTQDGRGYKRVTIKEVEDDSLRVSHSNGFAVIPFTELPDSLADRITEPPSAIAMIDIAAVLDQRPNALKTKNQIYDGRKSASDEDYKAAKDARTKESAAIRERQEKSRLARTKAAEAAREADEAERQKEAMLKKATGDKYNDLRGEISTLNSAIYKQEATRDRVRNEMQNRPIRPSQADITNAGVPYDRKIAGLRAAIADKTAEMKKLK